MSNYFYMRMKSYCDSISSKLQRCREEYNSISTLISNRFVFENIRDYPLNHQKSRETLALVVPLTKYFPEYIIPQFGIPNPLGNISQIPIGVYNWLADHPNNITVGNYLEKILFALLYSIRKAKEDLKNSDLKRTELKLSEDQKKLDKQKENFQSQIEKNANQLGMDIGKDIGKIPF